MTATNTARKKGTRMELAAFIPATTTIKLARLNSAGDLAVSFTFPFIEYPNNQDDRQRALSSTSS
jgi:hypothetical protein